MNEAPKRVRSGTQLMFLWYCSGNAIIQTKRGEGQFQLLFYSGSETLSVVI